MDSRQTSPWDYFTFARHSTRIRGSAAWIRDFHEETTLARRYSVPQLNKNMVFHDRFGSKPSSGKRQKRVWAATRSIQMKWTESRSRKPMNPIHRQIKEGRAEAADRGEK